MSRTPSLRWIALSTLFAFGCSGESNLGARNLNSGKGDAGPVDAGEAEEDTGEDPIEDEDAAVQGLDAGSGELDAASSGSDGAGAVQDGAVSDTGAAPDTGSALEGGTGEGFSVLVRVNGVASAGRRVFFQSAAGTLLSEHSTDRAGLVSGQAAPAKVTVLVSLESGLSASQRLMTFEAVATGDHLIADFEMIEFDPSLRPAYTATFSGTLPAGVVGAWVKAGYGGCGNATDYALPIEASLELSWPASCRVAASNSLLATAVNATDVPTAFSYAKGAPAFGAAALPVQLSAWQAPGMGTLTASNVPTALVLNALLQMRSEGIDFSPAGRLPSLPSGSSSRTLMLPYPLGFADSFLARLDTTPSPEGWTRSLAVRQAGSNTSFSFDLATALPSATSATLDKTVPKRPIYQWTAAPGAAAADAVAIRLGFAYRFGVEGSLVEIPWTFITLPSSTSVQVPELPPDVMDPASGTGFQNIRHFVTYFDSSLQSDYRAFLTEPARQPPSNTQALRRELNDNGNLRATTWFPGTTL